MLVYVVVWEDTGAYIEGVYLGLTVAQEKAKATMKEHDAFTWEMLAPDRWYGEARIGNAAGYRGIVSVKIVRRELVTAVGFVAGFVAETTESDQIAPSAVTPSHPE